MMDQIKSEFRKLLSIRSTYIITTLVIAFVAFIAFYVEGWRLKPNELLQTNQLSSDVFGALSLSVFGAIVAILLMTHEYRYNTIVYTLVNSNSRNKVLLAKILVISCYGLLLTALIAVLSPVMTYLGVHAHGHVLGPQTLHYGNLVWRSLFFGWSYALAGLLLATLLRSQIGAIAALFVIPIGEALLSQLLANNAVYLPFTSQGMILGNTTSNNHSISPERGAVVFALYLAVGWIVAWILFLRRDAN